MSIELALSFHEGNVMSDANNPASGISELKPPQGKGTSRWRWFVLLFVSFWLIKGIFAVVTAPARSSQVVAAPPAIPQAPARAETASPEPLIHKLRREDPDLRGLDDDQVVDVMRGAYYPDLSREQIAAALGVTLWKPKALTPLERMRYDDCLAQASRTPTTHGVQLAESVCRRRFEQEPSK